jgi:membrane associated rhomboid family serine protease
LFGTFGGHGSVCLWLIGIMVGIFVVLVVTTRGGDDGLNDVSRLLVLRAQPVLHGEVWRLLTYTFLHNPYGLWGFVFSMLFLWWFGKDTEDIYGGREFLAFYLAAVLVAGIALVLMFLALQPPVDPPYMGSWAPVAAVLVLCALHDPRRIILLFFILPVPIWLIAAAAVITETYFVLVGVSHPGEKSAAVSGVAATPGLTAAAFAFLYYKFQWRVSTLWPDFRALKRRLTRPSLRVYREEEPPTPVSVGAALPPDEEQLEAKMDAILEKISRTGKESLTESERQLLLRASEVFKRRRS